MPSSVTLDGSRIYRPGVYGIIDASSLGGSGISTGNLAVVGPFPTIEQNTPLTFTSARAVRDFDPEDLTLQLIARLAFAPSTDSRVPGGAGSLTIVNSQTTAQAGLTLPDDTSAGSLVLESKLWGTKGNRTYGRISVNAASATAVDILITRGTTSESFEALESGPVADFYHAGTQLSEVKFTVSPTQLLWKWRKDHVFTAPGGAQSTAYSALTETVIQNGETILIESFNGTGGGVFASGKTLTVTVVGLDAAGAAQTVVTTITYAEFNGGTTSKTPTETWSKITEITYAHDDDAFDGSAQVTAAAYDLDLTTDFDYIGQVTALIANNASKGWKADALHPRINKIPANQIDAASAINTQNGTGGSTNKHTARADLWYIVDAMASSSLVTATRHANATTRPGPASLVSFSSDAYFVGGSVGVTGDADYDDALQVIENSDVQIVIPMSENLTVHKKLITHCVTSALAGYERNAYVGIPKSQTLAAAFADYTSKLNSRHVAAFGQEIQVENASGELEYVDPLYGAIMLAGMQAGTSVATPLTWKRPSVYATRESWDRNRDANEAISKGLINLSSDTLGIRVERSVTTHLEDDNPIYSEVTANESINTSVRDLRAEVKGKIGDAMYANTAGKMKTVVEARLNRQIKDGIIKAWRNVSLDDLGDRIDITYEVAAVEPLNFIILRANVVRIASET
jgi:hypothetical protein